MRECNWSKFARSDERDPHIHSRVDAHLLLIPTHKSRTQDRLARRGRDKDTRFASPFNLNRSFL